MTLRTNARLAGFTFLFYIAAAFPGAVLIGRATSGQGTAARLANIARHTADVRVGILLELLGCFSALVLAVTLHAITRDEDRDLALLGLICRVAEGVLGAAGLSRSVGLLQLVTPGPGLPDVATANALGAFLLMPGSIFGAVFFAAGSSLFSYLLMRGRAVPMPLAWLGILSSALLVVALPLQAVGFVKGAVTWYVWMPMLVFEVALALWLLIKGVAAQGAAERERAQQ